MAMLSFCGIDVSKDRLDVMVLPQQQCFSMRNAGKVPKIVIVAVVRKMITTLNAMVRDDVVWADLPPGRHTVPTAR